MRDGSDGSPFTEEDFQKWSEWFISKHPEHAVVLRGVAEWKTKLWPWSKRAELIKHLAQTLPSVNS